MKVNDIEILISDITTKIIKDMTNHQACESQVAMSLIRQVGEYPKEIIEEIGTRVKWVRCEDKAASALLVNTLTLQQLVAISNLQVIDYATSVINQFLLMGKPVWVLVCEIDQKQLRKNTKYGLFKRFEEIYQRAISFGMDFQFTLTKLEEVIASKRRRKPADTFEPKTFLTEAQLINLLEESTVIDVGNHRLTPLAKDYIQENNIRIGGG